MQGICEGDEHKLWSNDSRPVYRGIHALRSSKPIPQCTAVRADGGALRTESEVKAFWAGYFKRLSQADQQAVELHVSGVTVPIADPPVNCRAPSCVEPQAAMNRLKWDKAPGIWSIHAEFFQGWWKCCTRVITCSFVLCLEHKQHLH